MIFGQRPGGGEEVSNVATLEKSSSGTGAAVKGSEHAWNVLVIARRPVWLKQKGSCRGKCSSSR